MKNIFLVTVVTLLSTITAEPLLYSYYAPSYPSAYLGSSSAPLLSAPLTQFAQLTSVNGPLAPLGAVAPVAPVAPVASVAPVTSVAAAPAPVVYPTSSVSAYSYAYNVNDYQLVNPAASLQYSIPYAYAADWYYRK